MEIYLFRLNRLPVSCRRQAPLFKRACRLTVGAAAKRAGELNMIFGTNPEIRRINQKYLRHNYYTDVIAFAYPSASAPPVDRTGINRRPSHTVLPPSSSMKEGLPNGDIFISVDQARLQAKELNHSWLEELLTLAIHGTLHLMGYDDHAPAERKRMFARQDRILKTLLKRPRRGAGN